MLLIPCPWCGPRPDTEFVAGGQAREPLHAGDRQDDANWADQLWGRDNPRGPLHERWWHVHGCRLWLTVRRDTRDHRILDARAASAPASAAPAWTGDAG